MVLKSKPGTYALLFVTRHPKRVRIGRLGAMRIEPGYYLYVGSAFGPGGVRARVERHARRGGARHWHIDYLKRRLELLEAWITHDRRRLEHEWAERLASLRGAEQPMRGFGSSDCRCRSHLFFLEARPAGNALEEALGESDNVKEGIEIVRWMPASVRRRRYTAESHRS